MPNTKTTTKSSDVSSAAKQAMADFAVELRGEGLREVLATLLHTTAYRFLGIWRSRMGRPRRACDDDLVPRDPEQIDIPSLVGIASYLGLVGLGGHVPPYLKG